MTIKRSMVNGVPTFSGGVVTAGKQVTTTRRVVDDINSIIRTDKTTSILDAKNRLPLAGGTKTVYQEDSAGSSSIASPLTETARTVKEYSDGEHTYRVAVQSTCDDANGAEVVINWLDPDSPNITVET